VECWNTGYEKRKKIYSTKMLNLTFMMIVVRHPFSAFAPKNTPMLREYQYNTASFHPADHAGGVGHLAQQLPLARVVAHPRAAKFLADQSIIDRLLESRIMLDIG
jgi:hypothetical protein